jgi:hypothetical protein
MIGQLIAALSCDLALIKSSVIGYLILTFFFSLKPVCNYSEEAKTKNDIFGYIIKNKHFDSTIESIKISIYNAK